MEKKEKTDKSVKTANAKKPKKAPKSAAEKKLDKEFKKKEKVAGENLKKALAKRRQELPMILSRLETQKTLLELRAALADMNPPLHDIVQNLSVYCPELGVKYMLQPCIAANNYAMSKVLGRSGKIKLRLLIWWHRLGLGKKLKFGYATKYDTLREHYLRLSDLAAATDSEEIIHSFTEIVDNLQKIAPDKNVFLLLANALNEYNNAAIDFFKVTQENYRSLTLDDKEQSYTTTISK